LDSPRGLSVRVGPDIPGSGDATGLIHRSDFGSGASKFNAVVGDDVKLIIDVEIEKQ
jgi:hypothetical protein